MNVFVELGDTAEEIAINLAWLKCQGFESNYGYCPIARFLRLRGYTGVEVTSSCYWVDQIDKGYKALPKPIKSFIETFDHSARFPSLKMTIERGIRTYGTV